MTTDSENGTEIVIDETRRHRPSATNPSAPTNAATDARRSSRLRLDPRFALVRRESLDALTGAIGELLDLMRAAARKGE